jgi:hypothetical protein
MEAIQQQSRASTGQSNCDFEEDDEEHDDKEDEVDKKVAATPKKNKFTKKTVKRKTQEQQIAEIMAAAYEKAWDKREWRKFKFQMEEARSKKER